MLFLTHKFFAFFQPVRLALDVDNGAVMQDTVQDSGGDGDVGKDLVPLGEGLVGGKNGGRFLIPSGNELEKEICKSSNDQTFEGPAPAARISSRMLFLG